MPGPAARRPRPDQVSIRLGPLDLAPEVTRLPAVRRASSGEAAGRDGLALGGELFQYLAAQ